MADKKTKQLTLQEVSKHNSQESCWLIIGNYNNGGPKVYDVSKYLDDHPGGAEVMLDVAGQDADEFFEDIGHSNDAREELKKYLIGDLFVDEETKKRMQEEAEKAAAAKNASGSTSLLIILVAILAIVYGYYKTQAE